MLFFCLIFILVDMKKLILFLLLFTFCACASKKEVITDKGITTENHTNTNKQEKEEVTEESTTLEFAENEEYYTGSETIIFGDSGRYNTKTGEATDVKKVINDTTNKTQQNTTKHNKTQQNTTKNTEVNTTDSLIFNKKNITQEVEIKQNNWYIWVIIGGVLVIVVIVGIRILLKSILL